MSREAQSSSWSGKDFWEMPARHAGARLNYDCMALINAGSTGRRRAVLAGRHFPARSARVVRLRHRASPLMYFFSETTTPPDKSASGCSPRAAAHGMNLQPLVAGPRGEAWAGLEVAESAVTRSHKHDRFTTVSLQRRFRLSGCFVGLSGPCRVRVASVTRRDCPRNYYRDVAHRS